VLLPIQNDGASITQKNIARRVVARQEYQSRHAQCQQIVNVVVLYLKRKHLQQITITEQGFFVAGYACRAM